MGTKPALHLIHAASNVFIHDSELGLGGAASGICRILRTKPDCKGYRISPNWVKVSNGMTNYVQGRRVRQDISEHHPPLPRYMLMWSELAETENERDLGALAESSRKMSAHSGAGAAAAKKPNRTRGFIRKGTGNEAANIATP